MKKTFFGCILSLSLAVIPVWADDAPNAGNSGNKQPSDQTDNNYYWQGTQLYNLGRLGEAFDSFEKAIQRKQNTKEAEAYLLQIRQEIVTNAKKRAEERATLNYGGNSPDSALNVQYVQKGYIKITLQAKYLFDENTASLKTASLDVLNRLADLMQAKEGNRVELTMVDELDTTAKAHNIDAERALLVFGYLNFKKTNSSASAPSSSS
jgi:outer membrane protein OmpA-like peptidoglycan-associated protein